MGRIFIGAGLVALCLMGQTHATAASLEGMDDEKAIRQVIETFTEGWTACNSEQAAQFFVEDADWLNSFGIRKKGRQEIQNFFERGFALRNAKEREDTITISSIRFIRPDIALVHAEFVVKRQRYITGEEMADRKGHEQYVMVKESGKWWIASLFIMDEKSRVPTSLDPGWRPSSN